MAISDKDLKKLWGRSAGRCSKPGCAIECLPHLDDSDPTVIGEMAHIIARSPDGPRGIAGGGDDSYDNLILLCPTHHTEIDKAPDGTFTADVLADWKASHEHEVSSSFTGQKYDSQEAVGVAIKRLLEVNKTIWEQYGPESEEAATNPLSSAFRIWELRKLDTLVPNNEKIINILRQNQELVDVSDTKVCAEFTEHARGFEQNCYERTEGVPRFPQDFEELIDHYAGL